MTVFRFMIDMYNELTYKCQTICLTVFKKSNVILNVFSFDQKEGLRSRHKERIIVGIKRVFVVSAGLMDGGIAQVCAQAGIRVILGPRQKIITQSFLSFGPSTALHPPAHIH